MKFGFFDTFSIVGGLLLIAVPGFILVKAKIVKQEFIAQLAKFVLYACQPLLMISCFQSTTFSIDAGIDMLYIVLFSVVLYAIFVIFTKLAFIWVKEKEKARVLNYASVFGNIGFMGIPIVKALLPNNDSALLCVTIVLATFNIITFTLGVFIITGDRKNISFVKALLNPTMIGVYIGLALFFFNIKLPEILSTPISLLGNLCITLSMTMTGMRFALADYKKLFSNAGIYISSVIKLAIIPLSIYGITLLFNASATVGIVMLITSAMPTASITLMFSEVYNQDSELASGAILVSTILSIISVPLILLVAA